ncbi:hypothetical protein B7494_g2329 [Chlorociboria aeruginascens]|nr:hypothetical protein B7494_g2329 [Chlorociboria aeruginascens]
MRFVRVLFMALLLDLSIEFSFRGSQTSRAGSTDLPTAPDLPPEFNPTELLDSKSRKTEIYTKAMVELKRLEEEPLCHRVAAQLLMNNCQGLENISEQEYQLQSPRLQRHHVESFAASLAICDLERGRFVIPNACMPFSSSVLFRVSQDRKGNLQVSPDQVGECLEALGQDHSHWNTWLSYRDKALLFCRAARLDIDKDQSILLHKQLTKIMTEFATELDYDLKCQMEKMAEYAHATNLYFEGVRSQAELMANKFHKTYEEMDLGLKSSMKSAMGTAEDIHQLVKTIFITALQGNAEMAANQEQAVSVTANAATLHLEAMKASYNDIHGILKMIDSRMVSMGTRQDTMEIKFINIATLLQNHTDALEQATFAASEIHKNLEKASAAASSMSLIGNLSSYVPRVGCALGFVIIGSYRLPPSLIVNGGLGLAGFAFGGFMVKVKEWEWTHSVSNVTVSAFTHLAREYLRH